MRLLASVTIALIAILGTTTSTGAASTVDHQAWSQSQPVATFVPKANEIYVAMTASLEEARSFVHIGTAGLSAADLQGATLVLKEASGDELQPATAGIAACALAAPFTGDGQLHGGIPAADCTLRTDVSRDQAGNWTVELGIFADRWAGGVNNGIVLFPESASQTTAFRVAFDTSLTAFQGAAVAPAQPPADANEPAATGISAAIGAPEPAAPF
jgi:hypothetical protein